MIYFYHRKQYLLDQIIPKTFELITTNKITGCRPYIVMEREEALKEWGSRSAPNNIHDFYHKTQYLLDQSILIIIYFILTKRSTDCRPLPPYTVMERGEALKAWVSHSAPNNVNVFNHKTQYLLDQSIWIIVYFYFDKPNHRLQAVLPFSKLNKKFFGYFDSKKVSPHNENK